MRYVVAVLVMVLAAMTEENAEARPRGGGGHYRGGHGSSHRGGSYKNKRTGDRYRVR